MNNNIVPLFCSNCGNDLNNQNIGCCPNCGKKIEPQIDGQNILEKKDNEEPVRDKIISAVILLILSIVNLIGVVPFFVKLTIFWLFFGAIIDNDTLYYGLLLLFCGYFGASIVSIFAYIINLINKGKALKKCFLAIFIGFCLGAIIPVILVNSNFSFSKNEMIDNSLNENQVVYENDDLKVLQQKIVYDKTDVKIYFSLETNDIDNYSLPTYLTIKINKCEMLATLTKVEDSSYDNLYYLSVSYYNLQVYNITDIATINFDIYDNETKDNINITIETDSKNTDVHENTGIDNYELLYSNEYFNLYFDPDYSSESADIYIQSLVSQKYFLTFSNPDFDTHGYINDDIINVQLSDYSIINSKIHFHPCNENMSYIKFDYIISDEHYDVIAQEKVELNFSSAKIKIKYCNN